MEFKETTIGTYTQKREAESKAKSLNKQTSPFVKRYLKRKYYIKRIHRTRINAYLWQVIKKELKK